MDRYEIIEEPSGSFALLDLITGVPAEIDGQPLVGLSREQAEAMHERFIKQPVMGYKDNLRL